jgi:hypothetical protein
MSESPPEKRGGPSPEAAPIKTHDEKKIASDGFTVKEFSGRHSVTERTIWRWLRRGLLVTRKTPSGRVRIIGEVAR